MRLHNDPFTTRDFVVNALIVFFELDEGSAVNLMLAVHETGGAAFGPLPTARAIELIKRVYQKAAEQDFPLRLTLEEPGVLDEVPRAQS